MNPDFIDTGCASRDVLYFALANSRKVGFTESSSVILLAIGRDGPEPFPGIRAMVIPLIIDGMHANKAIDEYIVGLCASSPGELPEQEDPEMAADQVKLEKLKRELMGAYLERLLFAFPLAEKIGFARSLQLSFRQDPHTRPMKPKP